MINFLHTFSPERVLISFGPITIFWYGIFIIAGILSGLFVVLKLGEKYGLKKEELFDISFWLIIGGIGGARIYHVLLEAGYYLDKPLKIFALWEGGLAIHGAVIADIILLVYFSRQLKQSFWVMASIFTVGLSLGQTIGRWGNYFNQELFGLPTNLPWGIPVKSINRPQTYLSDQYFHPAFLYESIGNFLIFMSLLYFHKRQLAKPENERRFKNIVLYYLCAYSVLRFVMEFIRIDNTPSFAGLRFPQLMSVLIVLVCAGYWLNNRLKNNKNIL